MSKGKGKGSAFERLVCRLLSRWWSGGTRDDIFWRTSNSGGQATTRSRRGKKSHNQYADIQAVDPIGAPLTRLISLELKCGYPHATFDRLIHSLSEVPWYHWFEQAEAARKDSGAKFWALIVKRSRQPIFIVGPKKLFDLLRIHCMELRKARPKATIKCVGKLILVTMPLEVFTDLVDSSHIKAALGGEGKDTQNS